MGDFWKRNVFFLLMILPCQKFCQVTSLGVVPRSRKVLLQLCVGTSNGFSTNLHDWWCQQQWCQYQSAVVSFVCLAPFFDARHLWGWVPTFFFHTKENGSARALAAIIVEHPLHCSGRIPCQALLTPARVYWFPRVAPAWAICPFETPASKGTPKLCQGFWVCLNLKYYLRPATTQIPGTQVLLAKDLLSLWVLGMYVTVTCQIVPRFLTTNHPANASVFTVVLAWWYKAPFVTVWLLPSEGWAQVFLCPPGPRLTGVWPSKTKPLSQFLWWKTFCLWNWDFCSAKTRPRVSVPATAVNKALSECQTLISLFKIYTLRVYFWEVDYECHHLPINNTENRTK